MVTLHSNDSNPYASPLVWRPSYHGGLFFTYRFSKRFSAVADLLYSDKGYRVEGENRNYDIHMAYMSVPVMVQYHLNDKFSVLAGGEFNLFLGANEFADGYNKTGTIYDRRTAFGLGFGVAYQLSPRLNVMARYFEGISTVAGTDLHWIPGFKIDSRTIQLSVGYFYKREEDKAYKSDHRTVFSIGFRQGISKYVIVKSEYYGDGRIEASSGRNGYQAEVDARFTRRNFYTSIGVVYSQKGGVVADEAGKEMRQNFLAIPVVIGYSPMKTRYLTFSLEGGLALNYLLSSENMPSESQFTGTKTDITSALYGFELSTDALSKVTPFISYRKEVDLSYFFEDMDYDYGLTHRGQVLSLGVRLKGRSASRDKQKRAARRESLLSMDSIVRRFSFGVKAGLNLNDTRHDEPVVGEEDHSKPYLAGHFGMYFQFRLYKRLSVGPEIQYIRKGFRFDYDGRELKAVANYLEVPLIFSYQITNKIAVEAGPVVGFLLNSKFDPGFSTPYYQDYYDWSYSRIGLEEGVVAGARYKLNDRFSVGARYYRGLSDISAQNWSDVDEYNTNLQLFSMFRIK